MGEGYVYVGLVHRPSTQSNSLCRCRIYAESVTVHKGPIALHEGRLALTANSLIPDRWTETKQASPLHAVWRRHFIWDFFNLIRMPQFSKNLNKLDSVHFKRECDVLCFWNMNYSCTFSNLQKEWINLTEFQQNYRFISKHAYFTFLNKIMPFRKKYMAALPGLAPLILLHQMKA